MSKIYAESSMKRALLGYWKRFVESGIGLVHKYRYDPFYRTELNVIGLQALYTLFMLVVVVEGVTLFYQNVASELVVGITNIVLNHATSSGSVLSQNLDELKTENLVIMGTIIAMGTAVFGYLITRLALAPARNALNAQKQFIGNIAHELRTPLSVIKTNTEVALLDDNVPADLRIVLDDTVEELDRISDIINNLLSLNVLVRPEKITFSNIDLGLIVDRVVNHLAHFIKQKQLVVVVSSNEYRTVWGNATALEQIIMNVLKNAANYTSPKGKIKISIEPDYRGHIVLAIEDSGVGINEKDLQQIFEPFFRADQSRTRAAGGSGLGLAIVSELVKLHRGSIIIRSAKNRGTSVLISLLCGKDEPDEEEKQDAPTAEVAVDYSNHSLPHDR